MTILINLTTQRRRISKYYNIPHIVEIFTQKKTINMVS